MPTETTRRRLPELEAVVRDKSREGGRWLVLTHDNPDPDALASASLLSRLLHQAFGVKVTAGYAGLVGRAENREMVKSLKLKLSHVRHLRMENYSAFALVDSQPATGNNRLPEGIVPDLVFDHHPPRKTLQGVPFFDVREHFGATASIVAEYLEAAEVPLSRTAATALVYAIRSETQDFGREFAAPDKALYDRYLPEVDKRALGKIQNARLPLSYFRNLAEALENLEGVENLVVSHLGEVEQPDIVPELADLLVRMEDKTWSLCTGRFEDRVYLSIRTTNPRAEAGEVMRRLVGRHGKGGGHGMIAGGWVPITKGYADDPRSLQHELGRRLAKAMRKKPDRLGALDLEPETP
jgi:nanoRNase/pAp phosphatase (c-di-AMP/oligoRNAs hydrolase)